MSPELDEWKPNLSALKALFSPEEVARLDHARRKAGEGDRTVAYCVFENPFARGGGIFAVATHLPAALRAAGDQVVLITPFHRNLSTTPSYLELGHLGEILVPFRGSLVRAELFEHFDKLGNRWVLIQSWSIFDAAGGADGKNPYAHVNDWLLLRDGLFASKAVPYVLAHLAITRAVTVHAQDWQFASVALTVKEALLDGLLESAATVITSHNPYDHVLPAHHLGWITDRVEPSRWPLGDQTVYQRMIPLTDAPLSTVSPGFAQELTSDPLQTRHFAVHLQGVLKAQGVIGIDNPLFGEPRSAFSEHAIKQAAAGKPEAILSEKAAKRRLLLEILSEYKDERICGGLDAGPERPLTDLPDDVPIFLMFGRLDPGQKGFDALARAIEAFEPGAAKFILTPVAAPGAELWADDLRALGRRRSGDVAVFPFRMEKGYMEAMGGASFAVMPSFYEPFGAATEAYLAGTPVVARATGGLKGQVNDMQSDPSRGTGILFREKLPLGTAWPAIEKAATPEERVDIPLYAMIAEALYDALVQASGLFAKRRVAYARLLANLYPKAASYSGERSARAYRELYETACSQESRE